MKDEARTLAVEGSGSSTPPPEFQVVPPREANAPPPKSSSWALPLRIAVLISHGGCRPTMPASTHFSKENLADLAGIV